MKTVTRYEFDIHEGGGEVVTSEDGGFVDYDDYISLLQVNSALQLSHDNIINSLGIKGDGPVSKLVIEYVMGLVAENVAVKSRKEELIQIINNADNSYCMCGDSMKRHSEIGGCGSPTGMFDHYYNAWLKAETETPATDAAIAEIKARGLDEFAAWQKDLALESQGDIRHAYVGSVHDANKFAANLRAGRKG